MTQAKNDTYDAVIIGAGMSGLVCGCYLAKAGMKVLIAEQHHKPGGYCTSFKRGDFTFDAAAHSFGSYREGGTMSMVLKELGLSTRIKIIRYDPSDVIITPDHKISFWADLDKTVHELQKAFPYEPKIRDFMSFMNNPNPADIAALRKRTFQDLLDKYFRSSKLKTIISLPVFGYGGLSPSLMSAFTGSKIFSEFLLDGGYYPAGGMQTLPDLLAERFKEFGGTLLLSCPVVRIKTRNLKTTGVISEKGDFIRSKNIVSNCDARQTFLKLLGKRIVTKELSDKLKNMDTSLSMVVLYLGIDNYFRSLPKPGTNVWFLSHYDLEKAYLAAKKGDFEDVGGYMLRLSPDKKSISAFVNAPFKNKKYWDNHKAILLETFIKRIEKHTTPELSKHLLYKDAATPYTLFRYTLNYKGAAYGWESTPAQFAEPEFKKPSFIQGLYLTGHWTTYAQGIPGVVYLGYDIAKLILRKNK